MVAGTLTRVVLYDVPEGLKGHFGPAQPLSVLLRLHLAGLGHGQQRVQVLGLGAHVVQQAGRKCLGVLEEGEPYRPGLHQVGVNEQSINNSFLPL